MGGRLGPHDGRRGVGGGAQLMATETKAHKELNAHRRKSWRGKLDHWYNCQFKPYAWVTGRPATVQESGLTQAWQTQAGTTVDPATITGDPVTNHEPL